MAYFLLGFLGYPLPGLLLGKKGRKHPDVPPENSSPGQNLNFPDLVGPRFIPIYGSVQDSAEPITVDGLVINPSDKISNPRVHP